MGKKMGQLKTKKRKSKTALTITIIVLLLLLPLLTANIAVIVKSFLKPDAVPGIMGYKFFVVLSGSMEPAFYPGDLLLVREAQPESLQAGDIIAYREGNSVIIHRILEIIEEGDQRKFVTKGDHNKARDKMAVAVNQLEGGYFFKISGLGNLAIFMQTPPGMMIFVTLPLIAFILYGFFRRYSREHNEPIKRLAVLALILTLATSSLATGILARYTVTFTGSDTAMVAKFAVKAMGGADSASASFDLFETINDTLGTSETNVYFGEYGTERVIAPGTAGSFDIVLENDSDVTVRYAIAFSEGSDLQNVPLEFSIDKGTTWEKILAGINIAASENTEIKYGGNDVTETVQWKWPFEVADGGDPSARDMADTELGTAELLAEPLVTATVTFTQAN